MELNLFVRQIIVHDASEPASGSGEYDVSFVAAAPAAAGASGTYRSEHWRGAVVRGEHYEVLLWIEGIVAPPGATLTVYGQGVERDPLGNDRLYGGVAVVDPHAEAGSGRWLRTTNGKHFDFVFALTPVEGGHAARPPWTSQTLDAPEPQSVVPEDYPSA